MTMFCMWTDSRGENENKIYLVVIDANNNTQYINNIRKRRVNRSNLQTKLFTIDLPTNGLVVKSETPLQNILFANISTVFAM